MGGRARTCLRSTSRPIGCSVVVSGHCRDATCPSARGCMFVGVGDALGAELLLSVCPRLCRTRRRLRLIDPRSLSELGDTERLLCFRCCRFVDLPLLNVCLDVVSLAALRSAASCSISTMSEGCVASEVVVASVVVVSLAVGITWVWRVWVIAHIFCVNLSSPRSIRVILSWLSRLICIISVLSCSSNALNRAWNSCC